MLDEAIGVIDAARSAGLDVRLVGGLAVLALCRDAGSCRREHRDVDVVARRRDAKRLLATLTRLGYEENRHVRFASAGAMMQVYRECAHRGGRGGVHADDRVDVYLDAFRQHHEIVLRERLALEPYTVPASDVLLAKLVRSRMAETDVRDVVTLLKDVEVREREEAGVISLDYLARSGARDWGLFHDVTANLRLVEEAVGSLGLEAAALDRVRSAAERILAAMSSARKGLRWRLRATIGERLPWHEVVDENDGVRIGALERPGRPAGSPTDAGRG